MSYDGEMKERVLQRVAELDRAVALLVDDILRWDRADLPSGMTPVPFMVAYGLLSQVAADLAVVAEDHDLAHHVMQLSERVTATTRALHQALQQRHG